MLAPHDVAWAASFADEAALVRAALGSVLIELHHIGSTAKPIIDMLAVVTSIEALDQTPHCLEPLRYESMGEYGIPGRRYFRKDSVASVRTHHLHAFAVGAADIERHLGFRDYLRAHSAEAQAYAALKTDLAARPSSSGRAYGDGKTDFIREMERRAMVWRRGSSGDAAGVRPISGATD